MTVGVVWLRPSTELINLIHVTMYSICRLDNVTRYTVRTDNVDVTRVSMLTTRFWTLSVTCTYSGGSDAIVNDI